MWLLFALLVPFFFALVYILDTYCVEEIFERRLPKNPAILSEVDGTVLEVKTDNRESSITILLDKTSKHNKIKEDSLEYKIPLSREVVVKKGQEIKVGQFLTDGPADLQQLFKLAGRSATEEYIINEVTKVYELVGAAISRKHLEIIIRQMFSRRRIRQIGDTNLDVGDLVESVDLVTMNEDAKKVDGKEATGDTVLLGISEVSFTTSSFIAAVAFGQSTRILIKTAIRGGLDRLAGLKENVIVGRLIPAGTGLVKKPKVVSLEQESEEAVQ